MGWFTQFMGLEAPAAAKPQAAVEGALGLAQGRSVSFDNSLKLLLDGGSKVIIPPTQQIFSVGTVDLGQSQWLNRYYMDDEDYWLQVHTTGDRDGQVESVILFNYLRYATISSNDELQRLAGPNSDIGLPTYNLDGVQYTREWGTEAGQTELTDLRERVVNPNESYVVEHRAMLYARDTGLTDRREFLLFSVEQDEEGTVSLSASLGISLYPTDLNIL
ncbi:YjfK family protein [Pseudomonas silvicola]|nr:YjfK family protein [Pseudomonas silvicola]